MDEENFSNDTLVHIVRDLREIDVNPNDSPVSEERQGDENIKLNDGDFDAPEKW